ncbi:Hypothetical predicted protein [Mytilus galloprovincialis]|uniref:Uncharacterized protein n=2 Tax=Mytilus galloprovincialis TaxID=29158 RepID=A0A8B6EPT5_MYTGA|nr:Hypothetical predicted protein [Mytilus galloprovincialis]
MYRALKDTKYRIEVPISIKSSCIIGYQMDDIEALHLLRQRKDALEQLPTPDDPNLSFKKYEEIVSKTMTKTQTDIEKVSKYAKEIIEEFEKVRELVKNCSVKIGEQLQDLMKKNLLKDKEFLSFGLLHTR